MFHRIASEISRAGMKYDNPLTEKEVYDLYWYFACERQNIFWKKLNGEEAPWTDDKILKTYKFCNSYRVNDRVSQYLLKNVFPENIKKHRTSWRLFSV